MHWGLPCLEEMLGSTVLGECYPQAPLQQRLPSQAKTSNDDGPYMR
jgi:hypothetical protein